MLLGGQPMLRLVVEDPGKCRALFLRQPTLKQAARLRRPGYVSADRLPVRPLYLTIVKLSELVLERWLFAVAVMFTE